MGGEHKVVAVDGGEKFCVDVFVDPFELVSVGVSTGVDITCLVGYEVNAEFGKAVFEVLHWLFVAGDD